MSKIIEFTLVCGLGRTLEDKMVLCPRKACRNCKSLEPKSNRKKGE